MNIEIEGQHDGKIAFEMDLKLGENRPFFSPSIQSIKAAIRKHGIDDESDCEITIDCAMAYCKGFRDAYQHHYFRHYI